MVQFDIDALLYHRVRVKDIEGRVFEGEVVTFKDFVESGRKSDSMGISMIYEPWSKDHECIWLIDEDECESIEILD